MTARTIPAVDANTKPIRRILVVEPDTDLRTTLSLMLKFSGYEVHHVADGRQAIALHLTKPFDLIITEIVMAQTDGLEILLALHKQPATPKFILLSRKTRIPIEVFSRIALHLGAEHLLRKPFSPERLLEIVRQVLGEK